MPTKLPYEEKELLLRIAGGDEQAFKQAYENWYDRVYGTALLVSKSPDLASDIAQDVFLTLWKERTRLVAIEQISSWLFVTTRNKVYNNMKRRDVESSYQSYHRLQLNDTLQPDHTPDTLRIKELQQLIGQAIERLPPQQQRAFRLSRERGLTHEQIAQEMNISPLSVKDYIVRALAFIRTYLKETGIFFLLVYWLLQKRIFF